MYNSLSLPNVYCTIKGVAVFIYSEEVNIVLVLITQLGVSLVD